MTYEPTMPTVFVDTETTMLEPTPKPWVICINLVAWTYPVLVGRGEQVGIPPSSYELSRRVGVEPPGAAAAHTAPGDAPWAARWWERLTWGLR